MQQMAKIRWRKDRIPKEFLHSRREMATNWDIRGISIQTQGIARKRWREAN